MVISLFIAIFAPHNATNPNNYYYMERNKFLKHVVLAALLIVGAMSLEAANMKTRVEQVTATVTITDDVDYIVESETPFADGALVNSQNTDHAVLILERVKPSASLKLLANHVQVNGTNAYGFDAFFEDDSPMMFLAQEVKSGILAVMCVAGSDDEKLKEALTVVERGLRVK